MRSRALLAAFTMSTLAVLSAACSSTESEETEEGEDAIVAGTVCTHTASHPNAPLARIIRAQGGTVLPGEVPEIRNFTAWPSYDPNGGGGAYDPAVVAARASGAEARENIASRYGDCGAKVKKHLEKKKPNVYVYFTGFGGATQNNSLVDEAGVLRWINQRDPKGLIFSINWSCADSHDAFCKDNAVKLRSGEASPEYQHMTQTINAVAPQAMQTVQQILAMTEQNQAGYNTALSHGMQMAAMLVDQLITADSDAPLGNIHFLGYSMGAHAASQVLVQDFLGDGRGYKWSQPGACDDGGDTCTVAHLKKVKWALSLGLSGWSEALLAYNASGRDAATMAQYRNGGLYRVPGDRFNGKANVFNRRMDPTSNSDDTFQRGFGDIFFSDYNHYSHDYSMPLFVDTGFVRALDAFLEAPQVKDSPELGVVYDNAGKVDFDECTAGSECRASTVYLAHAVNRAHDRLTLMSTEPVKLTDGVKHPDKKKNLAVSFADGAKPIVLNTFDQEDLRGGVELYYRPQYEPSEAGTHGLFSYGGCEPSAEDLMPQAVVKDGKVVFSMTYQGASYATEVPVGDASLDKSKWTHLAFTWELPTVTMASLRSPSLREDVAKHGQAIVLASGLRKPLPTTYNRQQGQGELRIFANGKLVGKAPLGTADSKRECLSAAEVLSNRSYSADGDTYPAFNPYARYDAATGDVVSVGGPPLGTKCKAHKVRNTEAFFGCAQTGGAASANAKGDMDDITLVWGPGRASYDEVDHATGAPRTWPIGVEYGNKAYVAR